MSLNKQIFTDAGIAMLGNANAGQLLTITKIVVGQGLLSTENQIYPLVALVDWKADVVITRKLDKGDGTMIISGVLTEANMPAGAPFPLRELGVMAKIGTLGADEGAGAHIPSVPGGSGLSQAPGKLTGSGTTDAPAPAPPAPEPLLAGEQLYCASNVFADAPDTVTPGGTSSHAFDITVTIDRATDVTVIIGDATVVDCENIPPDPLVGPGWYAQRVGNVFQFKRAVEGTGIELLETADRVTISLRTLAVNVDLYVPANHPAIPPGHPEVGFATIQAAHDYLLQFTIPPDKFATIHVYTGGFTSNQTITFSHPNAKQISLIGEPRVDYTLSGITYVSPTQKNATIPTPAGLTAGRRCYVYGSAAQWMGGCRVLAAPVGTTVQLSHIKKDTQANYTAAGGSGRLSYLPSVIVNSDTNGRNVAAPAIACPNGIKLIKDFCIEGSGYVVQLTEGTLQNVHVIGALAAGGGPPRRLVNAYQGFCQLVGECVFTDGDNGVVALGTLTGFDQTIVNACLVGLAPGGAGMAVGSIIGGMPNTFLWLVHCQYGVLAAIGANYRGGSIIYVLNDWGLRAEQHSVININANSNPSIPGGNGVDLSCQGLSYIAYERRGQPVPNCDPDPEVVGNQNSLIHVTNALLP